MNNDELILEIIEKVHQQVEKLDSKLDRVQEEQIRHSELLKTQTDDWKVHMARTEASEARLAILERYVFFFSFSMQIISGIAALTLVIIKVIPFFASLLQNIHL